MVLPRIKSGKVSQERNCHRCTATCKNNFSICCNLHTDINVRKVLFANVRHKGNDILGHVGTSWIRTSQLDIFMKGNRKLNVDHSHHKCRAVHVRRDTPGAFYATKNLFSSEQMNIYTALLHYSYGAILLRNITYSTEIKQNKLAHSEFHIKPKMPNGTIWMLL